MKWALLVLSIFLVGCSDRPADESHGLYIDTNDIDVERELPFAVERHLRANFDDESLRISLIPGSRTPEGLPRGRISTHCLFANFMPNPEALGYEEQYRLTFYFKQECGERQMHDILALVSELEGVRLTKLYERA